MPGSGTNIFPDARGYEAGFHDIFADFILTHRGAFGAQTARVELRNLHLLRAREATARVAFVSLPPEAVFVSFSSDPALPLVWRGQTLDPGAIMLHGRGERLHQRTVGAGSWGFVSLSPGSLAAFARALNGRALAAPDSGQILRPPAGDRKHLLRIHTEATRLADARPRILRFPEVVRAMEQELAVALIACLTEGEPGIETDAMRQAADVMVQFEDALAACPPQRWHLPELCGTVGVSGRTLQNYCKSFLGVSPSRYIQLRRLRLLRAAILRTDWKKARIGEIARSCGLTERSRFATQYRATFGEPPSVTLRRSDDV